MKSLHNATFLMSPQALQRTDLVIDFPNIAERDAAMADLVRLRSGGPPSLDTPSWTPSLHTDSERVHHRHMVDTISAIYLKACDTATDGAIQRLMVITTLSRGLLKFLRADVPPTFDELRKDLPR